LKILVTGGAGFIGSHMVERLLQLEHEVVVIDNFDPFYDPEIKNRNLRIARDDKNFKLYKEDIVERLALYKIFSKHEFDMVIHLAAKAGVRPSLKDPTGYYRVNVEGTINLLEECKRCHIYKFIFASSSSIYGNNRKIPFQETDSVDFPISPYAASKKAAELFCHNYSYLYGINIFALRLFTVYGPRQRPDLAIHKFFSLLEQDQEIPLYGDGRSSRDYTYIEDIIQGVLKSIERVNGFEIINLGESKTIKLIDLVELIEKITGKSTRKKYLDMQPGDVLHTYADISKARSLLDYRPSTDMETGLKNFYTWFRSVR
jgi:UDP-glucuronate 4-epimerase